MLVSCCPCSSTAESTICNRWDPGSIPGAGYPLLFHEATRSAGLPKLARPVESIASTSGSEESSSSFCSCWRSLGVYKPKPVGCRWAFRRNFPRAQRAACAIGPPDFTPHHAPSAMVRPQAARPAPLDDIQRLRRRVLGNWVTVQAGERRAKLCPNHARSYVICYINRLAREPKYKRLS